MNLYNYVLNDPVNFVDFTGLWSLSNRDWGDLIVVGGAVAAGGLAIVTGSPSFATIAVGLAVTEIYNIVTNQPTNLASIVSSATPGTAGTGGALDIILDANNWGDLVNGGAALLRDATRWNPGANRRLDELERQEQETYGPTRSPGPPSSPDPLSSPGPSPSSTPCP